MPCQYTPDKQVLASLFVPDFGTGSELEVSLIPWICNRKLAIAKCNLHRPKPNRSAGRLANSLEILVMLPSVTVAGGIKDGHANVERLRDPVRPLKSRV